MSAHPFVVVIQNQLGETYLLLNHDSDPETETVIQAFISHQEAETHFMNLLSIDSSEAIRSAFTIKVTNWNDKLARHIRIRYSKFTKFILAREVDPKILNKAVTAKFY